MIFPKVKLISSEGEEFSVDVRTATASTLIRNMIEGKFQIISRIPSSTFKYLFYF